MRIKSAHREAHVAKMAEKKFCNRLGIFNEGEEVDVENFVKLFHQLIPSVEMTVRWPLFTLEYVLE